MEAKISKRGASLVIVASDAPEKYEKKNEASGRSKEDSIKIFGEKCELGSAIGKSPRNVVLIMDAGFAGTLMKYLKF